MPAVILWVAGTAGALIAARWIMREARRVNAELHPERYRTAEAATHPTSPPGRLRRDASGVYRPE